MSYFLQVGIAEPAQIASNQGYGFWGDWAESLDEKQFGQIIHLYDHGWCQEPAQLKQQLADAVEAKGPDADTLDVIRSILDLLDGPAEVVTITNGIGTD